MEKYYISRVFLYNYLKQRTFMKFYERIPRSVVKVITWRIVITFSNFMAGYLASGDPMTGLKVAIGATIINSIIYFCHERLWNRVDWDRKVKEESST
jgi:uncharacterized membrane protein